MALLSEPFTAVRLDWVTNSCIWLLNPAEACEVELASLCNAFNIITHLNLASLSLGPDRHPQDWGQSPSYDGSFVILFLLSSASLFIFPLSLFYSCNYDALDTTTYTIVYTRSLSWCEHFFSCLKPSASHQCSHRYFLRDWQSAEFELHDKPTDCTYKHSLVKGLQSFTERHTDVHILSSLSQKPELPGTRVDRSRVTVVCIAASCPRSCGATV